jgi:putative ABC transport system substrate-binding protein
MTVKGGITMNRRVALRVLGAGVLLAPLGALTLAQGKVYRIAYLYFGSQRSAQETGRNAAFIDGMRERGYVEGKNFVLDSRYADGKGERLPPLIAELLKGNPDLLVVTGTPAIRAVQKAGASLPVVMTLSADPVGDGFAASLARPGGNITGLTVISSELSQKYLELLTTVLSKRTRIAVLRNPANMASPGQLAAIQAAAKDFGMEILAKEGANPSDIEAAYASLGQNPADALVILPDTFYVQQARQLAELALKHRLPAIYLTREFPEAGGLMSYGPDVNDNFRRAATYVDRILKGAKPGDLPIERPTKFEFIVNLKTAKALGLAIPQSVLLRADRVIE